MYELFLNYCLPQWIKPVYPSTYYSLVTTVTKGPDDFEHLGYLSGT